MILLDAAEVRLFCGLDSTNTDHDTDFDALEAEGLDIIEQFCGAWYGEEKSIVEILSGADSESIVLRSYPKSPITSVEFRPAATTSSELDFLIGGSDWQTLVSDVSELEIDNRHLFWGENVFPRGCNNIRVTYNSGFDVGTPDGPGDIKYALKSFISTAYRSRLVTTPVRYQQGESIPVDPRSALMQLIRHRVVLQGI